MTLHVVRRELAARWLLAPAAVAVGALAMIAIQSIGHVRGDADTIMNGTWVGTLVVSTIVGMSLLGEELSNSRLSFYFARPFTPHAIFAGKLAAGVLLALVMQLAIVTLVALALPALSWQGSAFAGRHVLAVGGERVLATIGCTLLGMAASIALGSNTRWVAVDAICLAVVGVIGTKFALWLGPDPAWLPANSVRGAGEKGLFQAAAFGVGVVGLGLAVARALDHGRTDRLMAHRAASTTLWPLVVPGLVALAVLARQTIPRIPDPPILPQGVLVAPSVDTEEVFAREAVAVPFLLLYDDQASLRVASAATWPKLDANRVAVARRATSWQVRVTTDGFLRYRYAEGVQGDLAVAAVAALDAQIERHEQLLRPPSSSARAGAPERGQLWQDVARLHREHVARIPAIVGWVRRHENQEYPNRQKTTHYVVRPSRMLTPDRPMVVVPPRMKAFQVLGLLTSTMGSLAVSHAGKLRPLRLDFEATTFFSFNAPWGDRWIDDPPWVEVRISRAGIVVEAVPGTPIAVADLSQLAAAVTLCRMHGGVDPVRAVDVLFEDIDAQQLVDVLVALIRADVPAIGIGPMPGVEDLRQRGKRFPFIRVSGPASYAVGMNSKVMDCYHEALAAKPALSGVMDVEIVVDPEGWVVSTEATGIDPELANCVARAYSASRYSRELVGASRRSRLTVKFRP